MKFGSAYSLLVTTLLGATTTINGQALVCGTIADATALEGLFDTVDAQFSCGDKDIEVLTPEKTYWHFYTIGDDETPSYLIQPEGWLIPTVVDSKLTFKLAAPGLSGSKDDETFSAVELWVTESQLKTAMLDFFSDSVEIMRGNATSLLTIEDKGTDTRIHITSPNGPVDYTSTGIDNFLEAEVGTGSKIMANSNGGNFK
jgi:hypothetical protein